MRLQLILVSALVAISFSLLACGEATGDTANIEDTKWVLESYGEQGNLQAVLAGTRVTATFDSAEDQVKGSAGCNTYFGDYQISGNNLSIPVIANTEMYCLEPEGIMEQENQYLSAMRAAESYEIQNGKLRIIAGSQVLVFSAE